MKVSTETGFTGSPRNWFDGKFLQVFIVLDREFEAKTGIDLSKKDHDYYFASYSNFHIHEEMLKDSVRTRAY